MWNREKNKVILLSCLLEIALPFLSFAQGQQQTGFSDYLGFIIPFMLSAAAILAVIMLIIAGLEMMTAAPGLREDAKKRIWGAVLGLLLAVISFLILNTIDPKLIRLELEPPKVPSNSGVAPYVIVIKNII
jgi:hypothetical protein